MSDYYILESSIKRFHWLMFPEFVLSVFLLAEFPELVHPANETVLFSVMFNEGN